MVDNTPDGSMNLNPNWLAADWAQGLTGSRRIRHGYVLQIIQLQWNAKNCAANGLGRQCPAFHWLEM